MESEKQRTTENVNRTRTVNVDVFKKWELVVKREEEVVQSSRSMSEMIGTEVVKAVAGMRRSHKKPIKRPCLLGYLYISFLLDSWKKLLNAILGSQETKEEVINGDELLLLFC